MGPRCWDDLRSGLMLGWVHKDSRTSGTHQGTTESSLDPIPKKKTKAYEGQTAEPEV